MPLNPLRQPLRFNKSSTRTGQEQISRPNYSKGLIVAFLLYLWEVIPRMVLGLTDTTRLCDLTDSGLDALDSLAEAIHIA